MLVHTSQRHQLSRILLRVLPVLFSFLYSISLSQAMQDTASRPNIRPNHFTGQVFHGFAYPTVDELSTLSLKDFAQLRPVKNAHKTEKEHFAWLFSLHPQVISIDPLAMAKEDFVAAWVDLWCREATQDPKAKKLPRCIKEYMTDGPRIGEDIFVKVQRGRQKIVDARAQLKCRHKISLSEDPDIIRRRILRAQNKYMRARERIADTVEFRDRMADDFRQLLQRENISLSLFAKETEFSTRRLNDAIVDVRSTSLALRHFLQTRKSATDKTRDILEAIEERKAYNLAEKKARSNQRLLAVRRTLREERKATQFATIESSRRERAAKSIALANQAAMDQIGPVTNSDLHRHLIRESRWWCA